MFSLLIFPPEKQRRYSVFHSQTSLNIMCHHWQFPVSLSQSRRTPRFCARTPSSLISSCFHLVESSPNMTLEHCCKTSCPFKTLGLLEWHINLNYYGYSFFLLFAVSGAYRTHRTCLIDNVIIVLPFILLFVIFIFYVTLDYNNFPASISKVILNLPIWMTKLFSPNLCNISSNSKSNETQ